MPDFIKDNWFVLVLAILITCGVVYFIMDTTKDNISSKTDGGKDVVATLKGQSITADDLYQEAIPFDAPLLYNMYKNAVIEESVETTKDIKKEAKSMEATIESNLKAQSGENYQIAIDTELSTYGFNGYEDLDKYCISGVKQKKMNEKFIKKHFEEYKESVEKLNPRTISFIKVDIADANAVSKEEQKKMDSIDDALEKQSFAKTATAFSEDSATAANDGFFGYVDSTDSSQTTGLNDLVIASANALNKGETSEWIEVIDPNTNLKSYYKIHIDETDLDKIFKSKNKDVVNRVVNAFLSSNPDLEMEVIEHAAKKLDIQFKDKDVQKKVESYIELMKGDTTK